MPRPPASTTSASAILPLAAAYNQYIDVARDSAYDAGAEAAQMILRPLFATSFLLADYLATNDYFGAQALVVSSASSKTAYGTALLVYREEKRPRLIGLTSPGNVEFTKGLGCYDDVFAYDAAGGLPNNVKAVYADFSGNAKLRRTIHERFGEILVASIAVGMTDWSEMSQTEQLPGPTPSFFFAPSHLRKAGGWGAGGFVAQFAEAWGKLREGLRGALEIKEERGPEPVERVYRALLEGRDDPRLGHVLSL
ncbi:MAG: DUF2855 family protein [Dehalococcoidia bacterium]